MYDSKINTFFSKFFCDIQLFFFFHLNQFAFERKKNLKLSANTHEVTPKKRKSLLKLFVPNFEILTFQQSVFLKKKYFA